MSLKFGNLRNCLLSAVNFQCLWIFKNLLELAPCIPDITYKFAPDAAKMVSETNSNR